MAHTPVQFVIHLNLASTCDENEGKGMSVHRLKHCHFNQVMRTLKSCNDKETCQKVCCTFRVFVSLILSFLQSLLLRCALQQEYHAKIFLICIDSPEKPKILWKTEGRNRRPQVPKYRSSNLFSGHLKKKEIFNGNYIITHKTPIGCKQSVCLVYLQDKQVNYFNTNYNKAADQSCCVKI